MSGSTRGSVVANNDEHVESSDHPDPGITFQQFVEIWTCVPSADGAKSVQVEVDHETVEHFRDEGRREIEAGLISEFTGRGAPPD